MKRNGLVLLGISVVLFGIWYALAAPALLYRYRLTVEIDTPNGTKSGSSVIETRVFEQTAWLPDMPVTGTRTFGEAVFVDLGEGRNAIAILARGPTAGEDVEFRTIVPGALGIRGWGIRAGMKPALAKALQAGVPLPVPSGATPTIITFKDQNDPLSVTVLHSNASDQFAGTFGFGYALKGMTVEIVPAGIWPLNQLGLPFPQVLTGVPVSWVIEEQLPWIKKLKDQGLATSISTFPDKLTVNVPYFQRTF
jgi:hypothetical protein